MASSTAQELALSAAYEDGTAPEGWKRKLVPRIGKGMTPTKTDVIFIAPDGEEIKSKSQLQRYLKAHKDGPAVSDFNWSSGETPRRSTRLTSKTPTKTPESEAKIAAAKTNVPSKANKRKATVMPIEEAAGGQQSHGKKARKVEKKHSSPEDKQQSKEEDPKELEDANPATTKDKDQPNDDNEIKDEVKDEVKAEPTKHSTTDQKDQEQTSAEQGVDEQQNSLKSAEKTADCFPQNEKSKHDKSSEEKMDTDCQTTTVNSPIEELKDVEQGLSNIHAANKSINEGPNHEFANGNIHHQEAHFPQPIEASI